MSPLLESIGISEDNSLKLKIDVKRKAVRASVTGNRELVTFFKPEQIIYRLAKIL